MTLDYPYALPAERYRELLDEDFRRLRALVEEAGDRPVPCVPGLDGGRRGPAHGHGLPAQGRLDPGRRDADARLGVAAGARCAPPSRGRCSRTPTGSWWSSSTSHAPGDHAATWWPPDQTVGFWLRRMAHETSIHRRDVESAVGAETPVAPDLAVDGIDEVLALMLAGDWSDEVVPEASGRDGAPRG